MRIAEAIKRYRALGEPFPHIYEAFMRANYMTKVLLIWEEVPENTKVFSLDLEEIDFKRVLACHGKFVNAQNTDEEDANLEFLSKLIENEIPIYDLTDKDMPGPKPMTGGYVVLSGFLL